MNSRYTKLLNPLFLSVFTLLISSISFSQEIDVQGNFVSITDGDNTPSFTDSTDFGTVIISASKSDTFRIHNSNATGLDLFGTSITGTDAAMFVVTTVPVSPVANGDSTDMVITFTPTSSGLKSATVSIFSNDANENPYTFDIQGTGLNNEIDVQGLTISITDGDNTPVITDDTDFGGSTVGSPIIHTFTILNTNSGPSLNVTAITISGTNAADFSVSTDPSPVAIAGSGSTTFNITFTPSATGTRYAEVSITNDDDNENPYNFLIQGNGVTSREIDVHGNSVSIIDGDVTPDGLDDTDFGSVAEVGANSAINTFTIFNTGEEDLDISNIVISGTNSADFTLTSVHTFTETITGLTSNTFEITFNPSAIGVRIATITITNNDANESTYNFDIQGVGTGSSDVKISDVPNSSTLCAGTITDSDARSDNDYNNNEDYTYTLSPTNAYRVGIKFISDALFQIQGGGGVCNNDYLIVNYGPTTGTVKYCDDNKPAFGVFLYSDPNSPIVFTWHSNGSTDKDGFTIDWVAEIAGNATTSNTNISCNGANDGTITVNPSPATPGYGVSPYQYEIDGGGLGSATPLSQVWTSLSTPSHDITISDANGCTFDSTITISEPAPLLLAEAHADESCAGSSDGILTLSATGGSGGYTYSFNNGAYQGSGAFSSIGNGNFPIKVKDANGCVDSTNLVFNIGGSAGPTGTGIIGGDNFYCLADSTIKSYTISGISNANTYTWAFARINNPTSLLPVITSGQTTATLLLQMAGVTDSLYIIVTASNACGSATPDSILVVESNFLIPVAFNMTPATIQIAAPNVDLTLTVNQSGGLFGGDGVISAADEFDPGLAGTGTWALTYDIDDPNGCLHTLTDFVTVVTNLGVVNVSPNMCFDGALEAVSATPSPSFTVNNIIGFNVDGDAGLVVDGNPTGDYVAAINPSMQTRGSHALNFNFVTVNMVTVYNYASPILCFNPGSFFPVFIAPYFYICGYNTMVIPNYTSQAITQNFYIDSIGGINIITSTDSACVDQTSAVNFVAQYFHTQGSGIWTSTAGGSFSIINPTTANLVPNTAGSGGSPYQITYEYTSTENGSGCKSYDTTIFKVHPLPNPWFGLNNYYSNKDPFYSTLPTPDSSGFYAGAGMVATDFYPNIAGAGTHNIIYNYTSPVTGCSSTYWDSTIVIANTGAIAGLNATYCYESPLDTLSGDPNQGGISGTVVGTFSISPSSNSPAAITNTGVNLATFNPTLAGPGNHIITFSYVDQVPFTVTQSVFVDSIGTVYFTGLNTANSYCLVDPQFQLNGQFNHPSGNGSFNYSGPGGSFINIGNSAFLTPQDTGTWNVTYTYTSSFSGCISDSTETIVIHPLPVLDFSLASIYCSNDSNLTVVGNPRGGKFSGSAVLLDLFGGLDSMSLSPSNTQIGANTVTYEYTDVFGCANSIDSTFTLYSAPDVQIDNGVFLSDYCELTGSHPVSGLINSVNINKGYFWGAGISDADSIGGNALFFPDTATVGNGHVAYYYYIDGNGCSGLDSSSVNVNALPIVNLLGINPTKQYCNNHDILGNPIQFNGVPQISSGLSGTFVLDGVISSADQTSFDPTAYPSNLQDTIDISYTFTDNKGCVNKAVDTVYVNPAAHPKFTISGICIVDTINFTDITTPSPDGLNTWTWTIDDSTYIIQNANHKFLTDGIHSTNLSIKTVAGCTSDTTTLVRFGNKPMADFFWINECYDPLVPIMFFDSSSTSALVDTLSYNWNFGDGSGTSISPDTNYFYGSAGDYNVQLIISSNFNCIDTVEKLVSVKPLVATYPYFTDFQSGPDSWTANTIIDSDPTNSWGHSTWVNDPVPTNLSWSTSQVLTPTNYISNERSYVTSPCFDFTTLKKPMIKFNMWRAFADIGDGVVLESSIDNGVTWQVVGAEQSTDPGINWYNHVVINNGNGPGGTIAGGQPLGWSDVIDNGWVEVKHDLDQLVGNSRVIFRIAFSANAAGENKGFAFDDVWIGERSKYVLVEHFTNTSCTPCLITSIQLNPFISRYNKDLINVQYHTNAISGDKLYSDYQAGPSTRELFYGASQLPQTITDGNILNSTSSLWITDSLTTRRRALSNAKFDIDLVKTITGNDYTVDATLTVNENFSNDIDVYMIVVEKQITSAGIVATGGSIANGEATFNNVAKAMLPDAGGTRIASNWIMGDSQVISQTWNSAGATFYDLGNDDIEVVVFIQDATTKEIFQAATTDTSFINITIGVDDPATADNLKNSFSYNLYPNPTDGNIILMFNQDINTNADVVIYDEMGSLVDQRKLTNGIGSTFSTDSYANGIYFMSVVYQGNRYTKRFIVMR